MRFYKQKILWMSSLVITFICILSILYFNIDLNEFGLSRTIVEIIDGDYYFQREYMWSQFMNIYADSPLFGSGFHISKSILGTYMHNDYLEYLVSYGLVGFILLLFIKLYFLNNCSKKINIYYF